MLFRELTMADEGDIFAAVRAAFAAPPWNETWERADFHRYLQDILGNENSLGFGLFEGGQLAALALGRLQPWPRGVEYDIDRMAGPRRGLGAAQTHMGMRPRAGLLRGGAAHPPRRARPRLLPKERLCGRGMARVDDAALSRGYVKTRPPMDRVRTLIKPTTAKIALIKQSEAIFASGVSGPAVCGHLRPCKLP